MSDNRSYLQLRTKVKLYIKTIAFVVLIGGYTIYNLTNDSLKATEPLFLDTTTNIRMLESVLPKTGTVEETFCPVKAADPAYMAVFYFFGVIYLFIGLAIIADDFFCPALDVLAEDMNLSNDVAGATLMAAGGSAPELFANLIGTFIRSDVGFGTIVGSAVFNVLFVVGFCALVTVTPMQLSAWPLMRDSTFYSITLVILALFFGVFSPQRIELYEAAILFSLYWLYVFVMYHNSTLKQYFESNTPLGEKNSGITGNYGFDNIEGANAVNNGNGVINFNGNGAMSVDKPIERDSSQESIKYRTPRSGSFSNNYRSEAHLMMAMSGRDVVTTIESDGGGEDGVSMTPPPANSGYFPWVWYIISFPLFALFINTVVDVRKEGRAKYAILAFVACLAWMGLFSYFLVCWVEIIGATLGIPSVIMGLTFLAAGTSVPDMLAAVIVAKKGQGDKAVSSSIGSNVFDICVGLAFPWLLFNLIYKIPVVVIADGFLISIIILFLTLLIMILTIKLRGWTLPQSSGYFFICLYFVYVIQQVARSPYGEC